ncbi:putative transporter YwrA [Pullulanibacillus camelliae]|uniref:Putative transporter YwrA n=1 Tax=Pullulanibacillus camelliae TaxID=1707096 RepID=A0A8J2VJ77_9BACL|nr:chromate transporter [Pullulanibacillus camelliae]GGE28287.1 putative transporter YwrA [Pullulanibacillus camelliae]
MIFWKIFLAFFIPGMLGYGGGPASIPLVSNEVVDTYHWMTITDFSKILALGNALPGPIATKMAGYIGFEVAGILGSIIAIIATVAPSLILLILLLKLLLKYKDSPKVKTMTLLIRPTIAVLLGLMAFDFFHKSYAGAGWLQTFLLAALSLLCLEKFKVHPAFVILGALGYGAFFLGS